MTWAASLTLLMTILALEACLRAPVNSVQAPEIVSSQLKKAKSFRNSGELVKADSVLRLLLSKPTSRADSQAISTCYVSILVPLNNATLAHQHINYAFPKNSDDLATQMRRGSFRMQLFVRNKQCDSAMNEVNQLLELVNQDSALLLKRNDLLQNQAAIAHMCEQQL